MTAAFREDNYRKTLVHGFAFAAVLCNLQLSGERLALSVLGFNTGIELMQLLVIALIVPWLMLLSKTPLYKWLRLSGATAAGIAALAWMVQRTTGDDNVVTGFLETFTQYAAWAIAALAIISLVVYAATVARKQTPKPVLWK